MTRYVKLEFERHAIKARVNVAFKAMRRAGVMGLQNFSCCGACAVSPIVARVGAMSPAKLAKFLGAAYYTRGDGEGFRDVRKAWSGLWLRFGSVTVGEVTHGDGLATGRVVAAALIEAGLHCEWDGDPARCVVTRGLSDGVRAAYLLGGVGELYPKD